MNLHDQIRSHVVDSIITPARAAGLRTVTVKSRAVHKSLGLVNRMPAVCSAIDAAKFADQAAVTLIDRTGPHQGATVQWTFRL